MHKILNKSTVLIILMTIILMSALLAVAFVKNYTANEMLKQQFYIHGVSLTNALSNTIWDKFSGDVDRIEDSGIKTDEYRKIDRTIRQLLKGTPVLKLKLYDDHGLMKYSSNYRDIKYGDGDDIKTVNKVNLVSLGVLKRNKPLADYTFRENFDDGYVEYTNRYIMSVYLPAKNDFSNKINGVVEIYYDVTDILVNFNYNQNLSHIFLVLIGLALLCVIGFLIIRNERQSQQKLEQRERYLNLIKNKNKDLIATSKELKNIKERTEKLSAEKGALITRMSHELRTPMNAVIGLSDLIMRTNLTDKQKGYVNAIQSSGNILLDITEEILTVGRLETGYLEVNKKHFKLLNVIEDVIEVMGNRACRKGLHLLCKYTKALENRVVGDPVRLRQILMNLVGNAIKYTEQGSITVSVQHNKGTFGAEHYHFEVVDTGAGIAEEDQDKIFSAYCYLNDKKSSGVSSIGLGLTICKKLVEVMHGAIGLESQPGEGTRFWFKLPLHTESMTGADDQKYIENIPADSRALIVMSDKNEGENLLSLTSNWGLKASLVTSAQEAKQCIEKSFIDMKPYTLFLIDSRIKDGCGIELCKNIRTYTALARARIVVTVPISEPLARGLIGNLTNTICINKPILPGKLKNLIFNISESKVGSSAETKLLARKGFADKNCYCDKNTGHYRILLAEDNPVNRELLKEMLSELKLQVHTVDNGHGAISELLDKHYDLILLDSRLPDMNGHEVARRIRAMNQEHRQPIIISTSSDNSLQNMQLCLESGVDDIMSKPITMKILSTTMFAWIPQIAAVSFEEDENPGSTVVNLFSAPILDDDVVRSLHRRDSDNPGFVQKLFGIFIDDCFERLDVLKQQLDESDYNGMIKTIHSIKSGCIHVGAKRMTKYCEILGNMARNQSYHETQRALQHFTEEFDRVVIKMNEEYEPEAVT